MTYLYVLNVYFTFSQQLNEMLGELFLPRDMPEPPKESFFRGLFGGGSRPLDREELCKYNNYITIFNFKIILKNRHLLLYFIHSFYLTTKLLTFFLQEVWKTKLCVLGTKYIRIQFNRFVCTNLVRTWLGFFSDF